MVVPSLYVFVDRFIQLVRLSSAFFEVDFVVKTLLAHTKRCSMESNK